MSFLWTATFGIYYDKIGTLGILNIKIGFGKILCFWTLVLLLIAIYILNNGLQNCSGFHNLDVFASLASRAASHGRQGCSTSTKSRFAATDLHHYTGGIGLGQQQRHNNSHHCTTSHNSSKEFFSIHNNGKQLA